MNPSPVPAIVSEITIQPVVYNMPESLKYVRGFWASASGSFGGNAGT